MPDINACLEKTSAHVPNYVVRGRGIRDFADASGAETSEPIEVKEEAEE
jgi:hypothetical protein